MRISRGDLRSIIREMILREQDESGCDRLLAAVLVSESPNDSDGMRTVYDVIQTRAKYGFKDQAVGDIAAQITKKGQFSGYNSFNNQEAFIKYYSGTADDEEYIKHGAAKESVKTEKLYRKRQFKRACDAIELGPRGYGATHFVNPDAATTGNKWWEAKYNPDENTGFIEAGRVGDHIFGWEMSVRQAREAYNTYKAYRDKNSN